VKLARHVFVSGRKIFEILKNPSKDPEKYDQGMSFKRGSRLEDESVHVSQMISLNVEGGFLLQAPFSAGGESEAGYQQQEL
jgi:hypothetical protein